MQGMANQMSAAGAKANMYGQQSSAISGMWGAAIGAVGSLFTGKFA